MAVIIDCARTIDATLKEYEDYEFIHLNKDKKAELCKLLEDSLECIQESITIAFIDDIVCDVINEYLMSQKYAYDHNKGLWGKTLEWD